MIHTDAENIQTPKHFQPREEKELEILWAQLLPWKIPYHLPKNTDVQSNVDLPIIRIGCIVNKKSCDQNKKKRISSGFEPFYCVVRYFVVLRNIGLMMFSFPSQVDFYTKQKND